jgi:hypothetical protein
MACLAQDQSDEARALLVRLNDVHQSKFPLLEEHIKRSPQFHWKRPRDVPEPDPRFSFGYDFDKYQLTGLGEIFGLSNWVIGDLSTRWIRTWDAKVESMYDFAGRPHPSGHYGYYEGTGDSFHSYGTYLARHALALTGGQLLLERPITGASYPGEHRWEEWRSDFSPTMSDGLWLADGTGEYPDYALHDLLAAGNEKKPVLRRRPEISLFTRGNRHNRPDWRTPHRRCFVGVTRPRPRRHFIGTGPVCGSTIGRPFPRYRSACSNVAAGL